jgi:hypothetical protein
VRRHGDVVDDCDLMPRAVGALGERLISVRVVAVMRRRSSVCVRMVVFCRAAGCKSHMDAAALHFRVEAK